MSASAAAAISNRPLTPQNYHHYHHSRRLLFLSNYTVSTA